MDEVPDEYESAGRTFQLFPRLEGEWTIERDGEQLGTLVSYRYDLGDPEWAVIDGEYSTEGYWPTWQAALDDFLDYLR